MQRGPSEDDYAAHGIGVTALTDWVHIATSLHGGAIEDWLRLYIRPQPWWLPRPAWEWLIRRTILMVTSKTDPSHKKG